MKKKSFYISIVAVTLFFLGLIFLPLANASDDEIFSNHNIRAVQNLKTTTFKLTRPMFITSIETYHWNDQKGTPPGKIGIRGVGLWQAKGSPGMHNTPNAYWTVHPNIRLEPGIYAITDSDPATWSQNSGSGGLGFVKVFAKPLNQPSQQRINLSGNWVEKSSQKKCVINQNGNNLSFSNYGGSGSGQIKSASSLSTTGWGGGSGTIADNGNTIIWKNGYIWNRK